MSKFQTAVMNVGGVPINGMNRYFVASSGIGTMTSAMRGSSNFMQAAWDDDPNKFQQLGNDASDVFGEGLMTGMAGIMAAQHIRTFGTTEGMHIKEGANAGTYQKLSGGGWERIGKKGALAEEEMHAIMKNKGAFKVNVRGGAAYGGKLKNPFGTYRPMGMKGNIGMIAGQIALGVAAKFALGFAGRVLDQAYSEDKHFRKPQYDNRFFNTQRYDQSSYQQLGAAMDNYENRMMSVARIYHARG